MIIGVDIGGTNIRAGIVLKNKVIKKTELETEASEGKAVVIYNIIRIIKRLHGKQKIKLVGIGSPGPLDHKKGRILNTPNLPIKNTNIKKIIQKNFKTKIFVDNDANCFTLAEAVYGAGKNYNNVIGLTLGTGVGGGIVINKKLYHGRGNAGELGHTIINFEGPKCGCGRNGCLEAYIGGNSIKKRTGETLLEFYELAEKRDKEALKFWNNFGFYLGIGIANIMDAFDPDVVVIGGKVTSAWAYFNKKMNNAIKQYSFNKPCKIVRAKLRNAGIIGAGLLRS